MTARSAFGIRKRAGSSPTERRPRHRSSFSLVPGSISFSAWCDSTLLDYHVNVDDSIHARPRASSLRSMRLRTRSRAAHGGGKGETRLSSRGGRGRSSTMKTATPPRKGPGRCRGGRSSASVRAAARAGRDRVGAGWVQRVEVPGADELETAWSVASAAGGRRVRASVPLGSQATFCILLAKSRPDVGGGNGLPSRRYSSMASSTI